MATSFDILPGPVSAPVTRSIAMPVAPQGVDVVPTSYDTIYTWEYGVQRQDLRNLYEKSKTAMWNSSTYLAWDTNVDPEAENTPDSMIPIYGTYLWDKLDKKTEIP